MVCSSVHEFYCSPPKTPRAQNKSSGGLSARSALNSAGVESSQTLPEEDAEDNYQFARVNRVSVSLKLREALKTNVYQLPAERALDAKHVRQGSIWTVSESQDTPSSSRPGPLTLESTPRAKSSESPKRSRSASVTFVRSEGLSNGFPLKRAVIRDNTVRANEWIAECTPKVGLLTQEKEVWVQRKEDERRRCTMRSQALQKMRNRAMPFDEWLYLARQAEQVADEIEFAEQVPVSPEAKAKDKKWIRSDSRRQALQPTKDHQSPILSSQELRLFLEDRKGCDWQKCLQKLTEEYTHEKCELVKNIDGDIERVVNIASLHVETREGLFLVQLGTWRHGKVHPICLLPSTKQSVGESTEDAISRMLKQEFFQFGTHVRFASSHSQTHFRQSPSHGLRTKYTRSVMMYNLEISPESVHFAKVPRKTKQSMMRARQEAREVDLQQRHTLLQKGPTHLQLAERCRSSLQMPAHSRSQDIYMLWHGLGDDIDLCTWLSQEEFEHMRSPEGERHLHYLLASVSVDPMIMPPRPVLTTK